MTKITACEFQPDPSFHGIEFLGLDMGAAQPHAHVTYEDNTTEDLFSFFTDELTFTSDEFVGLTRIEALDLVRARDIAYLRS